MPEEIPELMEQLIDLAETGAPGSRVDAELAIRVGRGRRRRRRFAIGSAAAVLAFGVGALTVLPAVGHHTRVVPAMSAGAPVSDGASPSPTSSYFAAASMPEGSTDPDKYVPALGSDPLVSEASFGWLPSWAVGGSSGTTYASGYAGGVDTALTGAGATLTESLEAPGVRLTLYPATATSQPPALSTLPPSMLQPADPVNGRQAYWVADGSPPANPRLQWLTDTGRWAELTGTRLPGPDPRTALHRIAENVRTTARQVPLPVWFSGLPLDFKLSATDLFEPNPGSSAPWSLQLRFTHGNARIVVLVQRALSAQDPSAGLTPSAPPGAQTCATRDGVRICVAEEGADQMMAEVGSEADLLAHFHLLGTDQSAWTTLVQR
ncbi:hypothetical protein LN042_32580 [Kitasatospora sp. RB6PN24]|uniref:hypothetical protein n=1 Tax=Kitasatospora humi TaxID=2893891 RepID=UPI001E2C7B83|nr:hypothetical protein [Kitasatospora humi]MCC9311748.1 hypothetical protein [Kitasatospora humi]